MYSFLKEYPPSKFHHYDVTWTDDEENWRDASPINYVNDKSPPFLIYVGTKTYPSIISQNKDFVDKLKVYQPSVEIKYLSKGHVSMMRQYFYPWTKRYDEIVDFIDFRE